MHTPPTACRGPGDPHTYHPGNSRRKVSKSPKFPWAPWVVLMSARATVSRRAANFRRTSSG